MSTKSHVTWTCFNCDGDPYFDQLDFIKHLQEVHSIDPKIKGNRSLISHIDMAESWQSCYEWNINGLRFGQAIDCEREKDDPMRV